MLSIFTPTHRPVHLLEAYWSLLRQSFTDWEWIIVPNNACKASDLPPKILSDLRVRVIPGGDIRNVGALKRLACESARGDVFIELDHDDMLVPGQTLRKIAEAFQRGAGFAYSDAAVFRYKPRGDAHAGSDPQWPLYRPFSFDTKHGWESYGTKVYGRWLQVTRSFDVTPRSLCEIFYAPDHVRCWSRQAYFAAGGHDRELPVCDDLQLMVKTYLTGAYFWHIGGCGYMYRNFDHNTVGVRNKKIQELSRATRQQYLSSLITAWLKKTELPEIDIRVLRQAGWNFERDLLQGFGYDDVGHIKAENELQRLTGEQVREFMNLAYTALKPGGYLTITVPEVYSGYGFTDVEWKSQFSRVSMSPYTRREFAKSNGHVTCRFQEVDCAEVFPSDWHKDNGFKCLRFILCALKGQRQPGLQHI